jgi:capsular polysaccharide transport system permease protein
MTSLPNTPAASVGSGTNTRFAAFRAISALMLREMSTRYGRSPGGYVWAILEPLGGIMVLGIGFSLLMRTPPLGSSFLIFYATGFLPFTLYMNLSNMIARAINFSKPLLAYPRITWMDAVLGRFFLNALTNILVGYLLLAGLIIATQTPMVLELYPILSAGGLGLLLGLGVGTLNCALFGLFPTWELIWSIATRPLFLASGVLFIYEDLPQTIQGILWWNPLFHITGLMRQGFYATYNAQYVSELYTLLVSLIVLLLGLLLMRRHHRTILNK